MDSVLVLIAAPGSQAINADVLAMLDGLGGEQPHWLAPGEAAEVAAFARLPEFLADIRNYPIDAAIVSIHNRRKRLLIADMDSTMIEQECIDELGVMAGVGGRIKDITLRAMRGELDFDGALKERVGLLKGLDAAIIDKIIRERITYMPGGRTLIATMKANGATCALVSGGFTVFTARIARQLGFDEHRANVLEIAGGRLTGRVVEPILGRADKLAVLQELTATLGETSHFMHVDSPERVVPIVLDFLSEPS